MKTTPLKETIKAKKLTIKKVSSDLGIAYENLSNYCRGYRQADHETLVILSNYLNVPVDVLLGNVRDDCFVKMSKKDFEEVQKLQARLNQIFAKYRK